VEDKYFLEIKIKSLEFLLCKRLSFYKNIIFDDFI